MACKCQFIVLDELLYSKVAPSCVEILVEGRLEGSGFIVSKEGLVITAHHVTKKKAKSVEAFHLTAEHLLRELRITKVVTLHFFPYRRKKMNIHHFH